MPEPGPNQIDIGTLPPDPDSPAAGEEAQAQADKKTGFPVRRALIVGLLAIATAGVVTLGFTSWRIIAQKDAKLTAPPQIGNLRIDGSENGVTTADYLQTALAAEVELDHTVGAVYQETGERDVLFLGGTGLIWTPSRDLDSAMSLISDKEGSVTNLHAVDPGPLDGVMKCGITKTPDGDLTVCGWADHGSLALAMFNNRTEAEAAPLMREIRNATETR
ncbi:hypothetical protein [Paractinoplanes brasiliensis]|uniref:Uncharacterized protein n=1 Tax=Paractinoplanes brasiliensis TaxID=52695 RepID=A0A4R6JNZ2_9ACTN|nr:hypothetical protein [Actinoplanes brasiliensis]TDO38164.1 hypothetical protein C8E87_1806 [Actinoplanes brasiliensis]GID33285.1 hypothetical protein Abr02nite_82680 [Actinoplanes brasiliensis]